MIECTVRAAHLEREVVDGAHAAEALGQVIDDQQAHRRLFDSRRCSVGTMPRGKNTMVAIRMAPKAIIS